MWILKEEKIVNSQDIFHNNNKKTISGKKIRKSHAIDNRFRVKSQTSWRDGQDSFTSSLKVKNN